MKRSNILTLLVFLMPFWALAQFSIKGTVTDLANNRILKGANVSLDGKTTQTDETGSFNFNNLKSGSYTLKVTFLGYNAYSEKVNLNSNKTFNVKLSPSSLVIDEVFVRATRATEKSPTTFKNISKEDLAKNNLGQDLPYLLDQTPSVVVSSDAGTGIGYTGIRIRGSDPTRINVTINGIPYNDPESQGTYFVDIPDIASSVNNIQIQRGVGTSTNGAGAFGGSINIQTTTRNDSAYAELNSTAGSYNTWKNTVNFGTGLMKGKFTVDGRLSKITSDGYIDRGSSDLKSFFSSAGYYSKKDLLKVNFFGGKEKTYQVWNGVPEARLKGDNAALLNHYYNNADYLYYTEEDSLNLWNSDNRTYSQYRYPNQTDNYNQTHYQLLHTHTFSPYLTLNTALHYTYGKGYYEEFKQKQKLESDYGLNSYAYGAVKSNQKTDLVRRRWLENDFYGITYSLNYSPAEFNLIIGGAYNEYDGDHFGEVISTTLPVSVGAQQYYSGNGFKKDFNTYGRIDFPVSDLLSLFADLQYRYVDYAITGTDKTLTDQNSNFYHSFFNPKAGLTYSLSSGSNVYASFAIANKEPNRDDYRYALAGETPKAENLKNIEAGYRATGKYFNVGANLYGMFYNNQLISTGKINDVGEYIRQNVKDSYRVGVEIDGRFTLTNNLLWNANLALSRNKVKDFTLFMDDYYNGGQISQTFSKTDIAFSPSVIAGSELAYRFSKSFEAALVSKHVSKQYLDNTSNNSRVLDAYFVNNLRLQYNAKLKGIKSVGFTMLVNNVFNEKYESNGYSYTYISYLDGNPSTENFYFPQAGTNLLFGVNIKF